MRICIVCDDVFPSLGGKGKVAERYAEKLVERGHDVIIFAGRYKNTKGFQRKGKIRIYRFSGIALPKNNGRFFLGMPLPNKISRLLKKYQIDVINLYSWTYLTLTTILAAKVIGIPVLLSIHSQPENLTANIGINSSLVEKYFYKFIVRMCNLSDRVQVVSKFTYGQLVKYGFKKKIEIISNGVDLKIFNPNVDYSSFTKRFHLENKKIILYVGRLMNEKNVDTLIKSFSIVSKKIKDAILVIVGYGFLRTELEQLSRSLVISDKVIFTGKISENDLNTPFATANLFVLPSTVELQGLVLLEAMACGKPILVAKSKTSAASELVEEGKNGYTFKPYDKKELAKKIIKILSNEKLQEKMSKYNLRKAKEHSIEKSVDKLEDVYQKLLKRI